MSMRTQWKCNFHISLVSIPVVVVTGGHRVCENWSRIRLIETGSDVRPWARVENRHSRETSHEGFGQPVWNEVFPLENEIGSSIGVDTVVPFATVKPISSGMRACSFVSPDSVGRTLYSLVHQGMRDDDIVAIGRMTRHGTARVVMIRPTCVGLAITIVNRQVAALYPNLFDHHISATSVSPAEIKLTRILLEAFERDEFKLSNDPPCHPRSVARLHGTKGLNQNRKPFPRGEESEIIQLTDCVREDFAGRRASWPPSSATASPLNQKSRRPKTG